MRFFGWSMTKSLVSLLFGIAMDKGLITSLDDPAQKYVKALNGSSLGDTTLRNLLNMSSGADICQDHCSPSNSFERFEYSQIGYSPNRGVGTDMAKGILDFKWGRSEAQGTRFNYTEICPQIIAWVIEATSGMSMPKFAEQYLWQPMGAESKASWLTDSKGFVFAGAGFSATLRDWCKLGLLFANDGYLNGRQVVSKEWIESCCVFGPEDQQVRFNFARPNRGYKNFWWHENQSATWLRMAGAFHQFVMIDRRSKTVLVQTGVSVEQGADEVLFRLFDSVCGMANA